MKTEVIDQGLFQLPQGQYSILKLTGSDCKRFLNGQVTSNVENLQDFQGQISSKVDQNGRWCAAFYLLKGEAEYYLVTHQEEEAEIRELFEKFIIMDDVEIIPVNQQVRFYCGGKTLDLKYPGVFAATILGYPGFISLGEGEDNFSAEELSHQDFEALVLNSANAFFESGYHQGLKGQLINNTLYALSAIDFQKGCYIGQETVNKIENNRGAAKFPCLILVDEELSANSQLLIEGKEFKNFELIKHDNQTYLRVELPRDFRVDGIGLEMEQGGRKIKGVVSLLPTFAPQGKKEIAERTYHLAIEKFQANEESQAEELFRRSIELNPKSADSFESLGVLLGRNGKYEEAIGLMDKLLEVDPDSVMAHTNKSLYLMKLGKIEEAEEEKSLATVAGFKKLGKEAEAKKSQEQQRADREKDLERRASMFVQVLELDQEDLIANFGLAEINYEKKNWDEARKYTDITLSLDPKHLKAKNLKAKLEKI